MRTVKLETEISQFHQTSGGWGWVLRGGRHRLPAQGQAEGDQCARVDSEGYPRTITSKWRQKS